MKISQASLRLATNNAPFLLRKSQDKPYFYVMIIQLTIYGITIIFLISELYTKHTTQKAWPYYLPKKKQRSSKISKTIQ